MRIALTLPILLLLATACDEQPYRRYDDAGAALAAGERERGGYPAWLPASATNVHLQGNLDSSHLWIRVDLTSADATALRTHLEPVTAEQVRVRRPRSAGSWWFESLIEQHPANDNGLHADLFRGRGDPVPTTTAIAFHRYASTAYIWTRGIR